MIGAGVSVWSNRLVGKFSPALLFAASESGAWYDTSDLTTMYQDSAGVTPAVVGQPVGLLLDKRLGLVRGAEGLANPGGPFTATGPWGTVNATQAVVGGELEVTASVDGGRTEVWFPMIAGASYEITATIRRGTASQVIVQMIRGDPTYAGLGSATTTNTTPTAVRVVVHAAATETGFFQMKSAGGTPGTFYIASVSVKRIMGNHATQATTAAKPVLRQDGSGFYYLEFDGVDDYLRSTFTIAQPIDRISALQQTSWTDFDRIFDGVTVATAARLSQATPSPDMIITSGTSVRSSALPVGINGIVTERHNGVSSRLAVNNGAYVTGDAGAAVPGGITISNSQALVNAANIRFYGTVMIGRALTDAETTSARTYLASKSGVVL